MLYHLLYPLSSHLILFNVFRYITFRAIMATLTAGTPESCHAHTLTPVYFFFGRYFFSIDATTT